MQPKVSARKIFKIFGDAPKEALSLLEQGRSKDEIFAQTGNTVGVQDTSFDVGEGEIFVVMGLSGSGKSTLVRMINGLITPTSGEMLIDGTDVANCSTETLRQTRRNKVAMVFQHFALFPHRTVGENVAYGLKIKGMPLAERNGRALKALEQVGLGQHFDSYPDELSGGMQQRVGLARGLAAEPEVLLMDEPFSALDPLIRRDMQEELLELQRSMKKTIIFITHDLNEALILGDKIAIMKDGRFVQMGTAEEIVDNPADDYVAAFTKDIDRSRVFRADSVSLPAEAMEMAQATPSIALERMDALDRDALHIVEDGKPLGVVTYRGMVAAQKSGGSVRDGLMTDFPRTGRRTPIYKLYPMIQPGIPIALTDDKGAISGVVATEAVFAKLADEDAAA